MKASAEIEVADRHTVKRPLSDHRTPDVQRSDVSADESIIR